MYYSNEEIKEILYVVWLLLYVKPMLNQQKLDLCPLTHFALCSSHH